MAETELVRPNPFALKTRDNAEVSIREPSTMDAVVSRAAQEVQAAMVIAKKYPRDEMRAWDKIMKACERPSLAEKAAYSYPKGGTNVSGPSIRLAECIARAWGNIDFGLIELNQQEGKSEMMAYAWDLETNCRETKIFTVNHAIEKKGGQIKVLTDPREIYELTANQGARRMRACILGIIPSDVVEDALDKCDDTLANADKGVPLQDRIKKVITVFDGIGVTIGMIEKRFNKPMARIGEQELVQLRKIYTSIRDGFSKVSDQFEPAAERATDLKDPPKPTVTQESPKPTAPPTETASTLPPETTDVPAEPNMDQDRGNKEAEKKTRKAAKEPEVVSPHNTLRALVAAAGFSMPETIKVAVKRFQANGVNDISEWSPEFVASLVGQWKELNQEIRNHRFVAG